MKMPTSDMMSSIFASCSQFDPNALTMVRSPSSSSLVRNRHEFIGHLINGHGSNASTTPDPGGTVSNAPFPQVRLRRVEILADQLHCLLLRAEVGAKFRPRRRIPIPAGVSRQSPSQLRERCCRLSEVIGHTDDVSLMAGRRAITAGETRNDCRKKHQWRVRVTGEMKMPFSDAPE